MSEPEKITVSLHIENHYELHGQIDTDVTDVEIEVPPVTPEHDCPNDVPRRTFADPVPDCGVCDQASEDYSEWSYEQINQYTGTGREDGDAAYFVEVTKSSDESVLTVGTEFEFGL